MGNSNNDHLSNDASAKEISEWLENHTDQDIEFIEQQTKQKVTAADRGKVRRNIEDIKEQRRLKEFLGDDYELLDS
ncbi:MAG: hypothetical protein GY951_08785 [Psychromonas sp.]|nr:hypothetical protein [Alteromonadales bacterium]MCP5078135.1 hypothetical protein [Psychromonas sp.]